MDDAVEAATEVLVFRASITRTILQARFENYLLTLAHLSSISPMAVAEPFSRGLVMPRCVDARTLCSVTDLV